MRCYNDNMFLLCLRLPQHTQQTSPGYCAGACFLNLRIYTSTEFQKRPQNSALALARSYRARCSWRSRRVCNYSFVHLSSLLSNCIYQISGGCPALILFNFGLCLFDRGGLFMFQERRKLLERLCVFSE